MCVVWVQVHLAATDFAHHLGKSVCNAQDRPGFIVNRVLMPMINEAFYALMEVRLPQKSTPVLVPYVLHRQHFMLCYAPQGVGTVRDIDSGMKLGTNQPMGPLQLADFIGTPLCQSLCLHGLHL